MRTPPTAGRQTRCSNGYRAAFFAALLAASAVALGQPKLAMTGSSTMAPLAARLAEGFKAVQPGVTITVEAGGSGRGIADARAGKAQIGMVSRALTPEEKKDLFAITIARDGVAFVVHRDNPVGSITREQAAAIYQGRAASWKALGGRDAPIRAITRTPGHSSLDIVADYFAMNPSEIRAQRAAEESSDVLKAVQEDRDAVGFASFTLALRAVQEGRALRMLAVDGVPATAAELRSGRYPLSRPLNFVTAAVPAGSTLQFLRYAQSPAAHAAITAFDFVPYQPLSRSGGAR